MVPSLRQPASRLSDYSVSLGYALLCTAILGAIGFWLLRPVWTWLQLHVPGEPGHPANITDPVDSVFYIRNAELGYRWGAANPTSIWFHPIPVVLIWSLKWAVPADLGFLVISLTFAAACVPLLSRLARDIIDHEFSQKWLLLIPILPGGINFATSNPEIICLFFTTLLLLTILRRQHWTLALLFGALAMLTKPNALYMIPILGVYAVYDAVYEHERRWQLCIAGLIGILLSWVLWISIVDWQAGHTGAYLSARRVAVPPSEFGIFTLLHRTARALVFQGTGPEVIRLLSGLAVLIVEFWLIAVVRLKRDVDLAAATSGVFGVLAIMMITNNPNKIFIYLTTLPTFWMVHLTLARHLITNLYTNSVLSIIQLILYLLYCVAIVSFFILGTVWEWYY